MKKSSGRVIIDGWYNDIEPLGESELQALSEAPDYDRQLKSELGIARPEGGGKSLLHLINEPSLNVNGLGRGDVGALARNIIPTAALSIITENLATVNITMPMANYDNNQHAENENIRLQNLWDGIEIYAAIMVTK